jgi:hypothetical protein
MHKELWRKRHVTWCSLPHPCYSRFPLLSLQGTMTAGTRPRRKKSARIVYASDEDEPSLGEHTFGNFFIPPSTCTMRIYDNSPMEPLQSCSDTVSHVEHGRTYIEPRVLISKNARAYWHEGPDFAYTWRSIARCPNHHITPVPKVGLYSQRQQS